MPRPLLLLAVLLVTVAATDNFQGPRELPQPVAPGDGGGVPAPSPAASPAPAPAAAHTCDTSIGRRVYEIRLADGSTFPLCLPRILKQNETRFPRTFNDTCGLYTLATEVSAKMNTGPPPHIHYAEDEWFLPLGEGQIRMYAAQNGSRRFIPGELPGFNGVPPVQMGSAVIQRGDVLFSPHGSVHFFYRETDTGEWWTVHHGGRNTQAIVRSGPEAQSAQEMLLTTALYGVPHDATGTFVGETADTFRSIRGPVHLFDPELERLQALFDAGEACYPADGIPTGEFIKPPEGVPYVEA